MTSREASRLLASIFHDVSGFVYIASIGSRGGRGAGERMLPVVKSRSPAAIEAFVEKWGAKKGRHLFFSPASLKADAKPTEKGSLRCEENALETRAPFADLDFAKLKTETDNPAAEVTRKLTGIPCPPSIRVRSGGGCHCYWLLKMPTQDRERIERLMRGFHRYLGADPAVSRFHGAMRLPGSLNPKYEPPRRVILEFLDERMTYCLDELEAMVFGKPVFERLSEKELKPQPVEAADPLDPLDPFADRLDVEELVANMAPGNVHDSAKRLVAHLCNFGTDEEVFAKAFPIVLEKSKGRPEGRPRLVEREVRELISWCREQERRKGDQPNGQTEPLAEPLRNGHDAEPAPQKEPPKLYTIRPWIFKTGAEIPWREWFYGRHHQRKTLSCTVGWTGIGKSSLALVEGVAMASGHNLLGVPVDGPHKVLYHAAEDSLEDIDERLAAICQHYGIRREDIHERLYVSSGREVPLIFASQSSSKVVIHANMVQRFKEQLLQREIEVAILDPTINLHRLEESSNSSMSVLVSLLTELAYDCNCAIELEAHSRKPSGQEIEVEHARGASALIAGVRSARVVNPMSDNEAGIYKVHESRRRYFRADYGKANFYLPSDEADWYEIKSVTLDNAEMPGDEGTSVGVVTAWEIGDLGMTPALQDKVLERLSEGKWRKNRQSPDWAGHVLGEVLGVSSGSPEEQKRLSLILKRWIATGVVRVVEKPDDNYEMREFLEP